MKPIHFSKILGQSKTLRLFRLALVAPALMITINFSQAGTATVPAPAEEGPELTNWIGFTVGGAFVSGDDQGVMRRTQTNGDFYGGISDLHYEMDVNDTTSLSIDGHAIPGLEDYEFGMLLSKEKLGYLKIEYDQFRTWYDATGGYSSLAGNPRVVPFDDERYVDRGELSFEAGLRMEDLPEVTFRYTHAYRDGEKDSLAWGDNTTATRLKLVPSLWSIDEQVNIFELEVEHTLGNTDLGAGLVYEHTDYSNTRDTRRGGNSGYDRVLMTESEESDLFAGNIHGVTRFSDQVWLSYAAAYSNIDTDIDGGSRSYVAPRANAPATRDYIYNNMIGGSDVDQFIVNLNLMWIPVADLTVTPSLRYEHENVDTLSSFNAAIDGGANASNVHWQGLDTIPGTRDQSLGAFTDMDSTSGAIDLRYKGIPDLVLYANCLWENEDENVDRKDLARPGERLVSDIEIEDQEYSLGANWYPLRFLSFSAEGVYGKRDQSFDHKQTNNGKPNTGPGRQEAGGANNLRPLMVDHNSEVADLNLRMNWRPLSNLSFVTRYDYCSTEYENRGVNWTAPGSKNILNLIESGSIESHIVSESVTWSPIARLYLQGAVSWISSETSTPTENLTPNSDNDYLTFGLSAGYAIDDRTDLSASYNYYGSSDYSVAANSMGYGLETEEHSISLTLSRLINPNMLWTLSYGFITSNTTDTDQSGGNNDFDAHMVSTGLQVRF